MLDNEMKSILFDIQRSLDKLGKRIDNLEDEHVEKITGGDGPTRVQPVSVVRKTTHSVKKQKPERDGREHSRDTRKQLRRDPESERGEDTEDTIDHEARRKAEVAALDAGVHAAVASFSPPDAPTGPPSRSSEVKTIWNVGDIVPCTVCKEPIYEVVNALTSASKLIDLLAALVPYSEDVPVLTKVTPVKSVGGVWFNCPRCLGHWTVTIA